MKIETGKVTTRDGREVVIHTTSGKGKYPVIGQILDISGEWPTESWTAGGKYINEEHPADKDLVPIKQKHKVRLCVDEQGIAFGVLTDDYTPLSPGYDTIELEYEV